MPDPRLHSLTGARAACPPKQHTAHAHLRTAAGRPGRVPCLRKWLARRRAGATRCLHRSARSAQQEVGGSGWSPRPAREARVTLPAGGRRMHVGVDSAWSGSSASVTHPGTCARPASWHLDRTWSALIEEHCSARWLYLHQSTTKALTQVHVHGLLLGVCSALSQQPGPAHHAPKYEASPRYMYTACFLALGLQYALQSV